MGKAKRSINPADALRKAQRKRELKKNKEIRKSAREAGLAKKDTEKLRLDIGRLEGQERSGTLDKNAQTRLTQLKEELAQIVKAKKEVNKPLSKAQEALAARQQQQQQSHDSRKLVFDPKSGKFVPVKKKESSKKSGVAGDGNEEQDSDESSDEDSDSDLSDEEENGIIGIEVEMEEGGDEQPSAEQVMDDNQSIDTGNVDEEDDDDIPMPEGPPPVDSQDADSDDDIDIPLPPGPPPPRPFQNQLAAARPPYHSTMPSRPPPPPPGPPPALRYPGMRPPPPPPPHFLQRPPPFNQYPPYMQQQAPYIQRPSYQHHYRPQPPYQQPHYQQQPSVIQQEPSTSSLQQPTSTAEPAKPVTISAEPQLRDLQKELVGFVPMALRRKQAQAKKTESLPKGARPNDINLAPDVE